MGLDELMQRLERDTDARVEAIRVRARAEIEAIEQQEGRMRARAERTALDAKRAERRTRLDIELAGARRTAAADVLRAEHAFVDRVLARARAMFDAAAQDPGSVPVFRRQVEEAKRFVEGREADVRCAPEVVGVVIEARDHSMTIDDTLEARLARMRDVLAIELVAEVRP